MKLEKIVTSPEMSKKLHEAGVRINTPFCWYKYPKARTRWYLGMLEELPLIGEHTLSEYGGCWECSDQEQVGGYIPAYDFATLWGKLPRKEERIGYNTRFLNLGKTPYHNVLAYRGGHNRVRPTTFEDEPIQDLAAEALLWCLKNKYISLDDTNETAQTTKTATPV